MLHNNLLMNDMVYEMNASSRSVNGPRNLSSGTKLQVQRFFCLFMYMCTDLKYHFMHYVKQVKQNWYRATNDYGSKIML